ncbi:MAG TPA: YceI family protein [Polyangia bacterium]|nr:YceI family protein [Polyangia bacterium]
MTKPTTLLIAVALGLGTGGPGHADAKLASDAAGARDEYRVDAARSRLIVETETSPLSTAFAHDHKLELKDYRGRATVVQGALTASSMELVAKTASLHVIDEPNVGEREAVEAAVRDDVLEAARFPEISFKSAKVTSSRRGDGTYDVRIVGDLSLHGVTRRITVPARVSVDGDAVRAIGAFEIRQTDFAITPFSFVKGAVVIKDGLAISFDVVANRTRR